MEKLPSSRDKREAPARISFRLDTGPMYRSVISSRPRANNRPVGSLGSDWRSTQAASRTPKTKLLAHVITAAGRNDKGIDSGRGSRGLPRRDEPPDPPSSRRSCSPATSTVDRRRLAINGAGQIGRERGGANPYRCASQ